MDYFYNENSRDSQVFYKEKKINVYKFHSTAVNVKIQLSDTKMTWAEIKMVYFYLKLNHIIKCFHFNCAKG